MRGFLGALAAVATFSVACSSTTTATTPIPPTAIIVDPSQFLGDVACAPGSMESYVATLVDVSPYQVPGAAMGVDLPIGDGGPFPFTDLTLPSSPPTPCTDEVYFERLIPGRDYIALIDGYDRAPCVSSTSTNCILALGTGENRDLLTNSGSRIMFDHDTKAYVAPRWTTSCGRELKPSHEPTEAGADAFALPNRFMDAGPVAPDAGTTYLPGTACVVHEPAEGGFVPPFFGGPVCATTDFPIPIRDCAPLRSTSGIPSTTGITVDLTDALAGLACGSGAGQVRSFTVTEEGASGSSRSADCASSVLFGGLVPGDGYTFHVVAFGNRSLDGGTADAATDGGLSPSARVPSWSTTCYREAVAGTVVRAGCDPLQSLPPG